MKKTKLFLIPYAGASSYAYYSWKSLIGNDIVPVFTELAGRGSRSEEEFYSDIQSAASDTASYIMNETDDCDYMIFGHSMGGLITYETYHALAERGWKMPLHIYISGQRPPHMINRGIHVSDLTDDEFLKIVAGYGGLPEVFYEEEIKNAFLPVLRADFTMLSEYDYVKKKKPIQCPVTVLYGDTDLNVGVNEVVSWSDYVEDDIDFHSFEGGHFFINDYEKDIIHLIEEAI